MIFIFNFSALQARAEEDDSPEPEPDDIEEVVVTGTRTERPLGESPVAVEVIDSQTIAASGAVDTADLLENHPGVNVVRNYLGATIQLRGLESNQVLVLVDGQRLVGRVGGATDISRIPVEDIERIEIIKGPASALYGADAVGGVVQIITKRAKTPSASAQIRGGAMPVPDALRSTLDGSISASGGRGPVGARVTLGGHSSPTIDRDPSDLATSLDSEREWLGSAGIDLRPSPDLTIPISGQYALTTTSGVDEPAGGAVLDRTNATQDARLLLQPSLTSERSRTSAHLGASLFRDQYLSDQRDAEGEGSLDDFQLTRELLLQLGMQRDQVAGKHVVSLGTEGIAELISSDRLDSDGTRFRGALYGQDEWHPSQALWIVPSARLDIDSWFGAVPTPRLALRADPTETVTLRASAGTAWRAPTFRELLLLFNNTGAGYRLEGNPDLVPEKALAVDSAVEWVPDDVLSMSLSGWWMEQRDLIDITDPCDLTSASGPPAGGTTVYRYENIARAVTRGAELTTSVYPVDPLHATATYTLTDARNRETDTTLLGRATHRVTLELGYDSSTTDATLRGSLVGPRPFIDECELVSVPTTVLVDMRLGQRITKQIDLAAGVDNLFDAGGNDLAPLAPRLWYGALDVHVKARRKEGRP